MNEELISLLRQVPLFCQMRKTDLVKIAGGIKLQNYPQHEIILKESDPGDLFFIIKKGRVKIYRNMKDGREVVLAYLRDGDFFGEIALLDNLERTANAQAISAAELIVIQRKKFLNVLHKYPSSAFGLLRELSKRIRSVDQQIKTFSLSDAHGKVALVMLQYISDEEVVLNRDIILKGLPVKTIAQLAGIARETVSKVIADFICLGMVQKRGNTLLITDLPELQKLIE